MALLKSERTKRPGVCYALTGEGIRLPIIDITHPAFALSLSDAELRELTERFILGESRLGRLPVQLRNLLLQVYLRGSVLGAGIHQSRGTFMTGMNTYLVKLGPEMLGELDAKPIDRRIAGSLPALGIRLRLQDIARMMAAAARPALEAEPGRPLEFIDIAGGPAIDSMNALIVLQKERPETLRGRRIGISVLDRDDAGPAFGAAALESLRASGAPLAALCVTFRHVRYDWADTAPLTSALEAAENDGALIVCSSEGGLFEYGADDEILRNLAAIGGWRNVLAVAASVTRDDEVRRHLETTAPSTVHPRGLEVFRKLVEKAGWRIERAIERPLSDHVLLIPCS